jgi:hypothetical protein
MGLPPAKRMPRGAPSRVVFSPFSRETQKIYENMFQIPIFWV